MYKIFNTVKNTGHFKPGIMRYDILISIGILIACSLIGFVFYYFSLSEANIISIYVLGILLIASLTSSWLYGAISSIAGVLLFNCLFAEPRFTLFVFDWQYSITTIVMLIASMITNYVMTLFRRQLDREILEARRLEILLETSHHLQQTQDMDDVFDVTITQLRQMFGRNVLLIPLSDGKLSQPITEDSKEELHLFDEDLVDQGALAQFLRSEIETEIPLTQINGEKKLVLFKILVNKTVFAIAGFVVEASESIAGFERNMILAVLNEVELSLEKHRLHLFNEHIAHEAETERLRTNILRTISHDLRTPLTSISGNADILLSSGERIEPKLRKLLYKDIYDDSEWLIKLVENLLFITRIENGVMSINTEQEVLQEIIPEAFRHLTKRSKAHNISLEMPEDLLVVNIEARLIMQVIINLVDNAIKYSPAGSDIKIRVIRRGAQAVVEVVDTGYGIDDKDKQKVFEIFNTTGNKSGDSRRGVGLGLSLCRAIVHAHGGDIHIADNAPCGAIVGFALNLEEVNLEKEHIGN